MGRRRRPWDERTREKIKVGRLFYFLHECAEGKLELSMNRLRAIEILLRKVVPDLMRAEIKSDVTHRYVAEIPAPLTREAWEAKYGAHTLQ